MSSNIVSTVVLTINGRSYTVGCAPAEEERIRSLAADIDRKATQLAQSTGTTNEGLVLAMTALVLADEAADARDAAVAAGAEKFEAEQAASSQESRIANLEAQLHQAHTALNAAKYSLEQQRDRDSARQRAEQERQYLVESTEQAIAESIERLAARIESVVEHLATVPSSS